MQTADFKNARARCILHFALTRCVVQYSNIVCYASTSSQLENVQMKCAVNHTLHIVMLFIKKCRSILMNLQCMLDISSIIIVLLFTLLMTVLNCYLYFLGVLGDKQLEILLLL